jgi:hypothetical protein
MNCALQRGAAQTPQKRGLGRVFFAYSKRSELALFDQILKY